MTQTYPKPRTDAAGTGSPRPAIGRIPRWGWIAIGVVVAVAVTLGLLRLVHRGEALPGVVVDGVDVGGLGERDVRSELAGLVEARQTDPVTFAHEGASFDYTPGADGYGADLDAAVEAAMAPGRADDPLSDTWAHVAALWRRPVEVSLVDASDEMQARSFVATVAATVNQRPFPGRVTADPATLAVDAKPPRDGVTVDQHDALELLLAAVIEPGPDTLDLPVTVVPTRTTSDQVDAVAAQAARALESELSLTAHGVEVVLAPSDLATLIDTAVEDDELVLDVPVPAVRTAFEPHVRDLDIAPRSARFEVEDGLTTFDDKDDTSWSPQPADLSIVPSEDGVRFDPQVTADQLSSLLAAGTRDAELELVVVEPDLTTEQAEGLGIDSLIGTFTTYHAAGQNRVRNIQRMADIVRGTVLRPGEEFSINDTVGERTTAKGFVADGTIVRGEYVDEVGGGVSQFGTTTYNAAFFAGLEIVQHKAHSYYISRYPMGREATLYYPSVDVRFRNDTDNGIFIHTSYTSTSITVSLFGDNGDRTVSAAHGEPFNHRTHRTITRSNPNLPEGVRRVVQSGGTGFDVNVTRTIDFGDREESERIFTRYEAPLEIVEVGTGPRREPEPEPQPSEGSPPASEGSPPPSEGSPPGRGQ